MTRLRGIRGIRGFSLTPPRVEWKERDVTAQIIRYLRVRGWRCQRQHSGLARFPGGGAPVRIGEPGIADWLCLRPLCEGVAEVFYLELKAPGGKLSQAQQDWLRRRTVERFEAIAAHSLEWFDLWYRRRFPGG